MHHTQASLVDLFQFEGLKAEQWFMRVSVGGRSCGWELLTSDSEEINRAIRRRISESEGPVTDLVLAFVGHVHWRGEERLMVHMQYFKRDDPDGDLFGSHVRQTPDGKLEPQGSLLITGTCKNVWLRRKGLLARLFGR